MLCNFIAGFRKWLPQRPVGWMTYWRIWMPAFLPEAPADTGIDQRWRDARQNARDQRDTVTIQINTNISIKSSWIEPIGQFEFSVSGKIVNITLRPNGCTFAQLKINDTNYVWWTARTRYSPRNNAGRIGCRVGKSM